MYLIQLLIAALPAILPLPFLLRHDQVARRCVPQLIGLFLLSGMSMLRAAARIESLFDLGLLDYMLVTPLVEEGLTFLVLCLMMGRTVFSKREAGTVVSSVRWVTLAVTMRMGMATCESLAILSRTDAISWLTVALRTFMSTPGHLADALAMGLFCDWADRLASGGETERAVGALMLAFLVPVALHGAYDLSLELAIQGLVSIPEIPIALALSIPVSAVACCLVLVRHNAGIEADGRQVASAGAYSI